MRGTRRSPQRHKHHVRDLHKRRRQAIVCASRSLEEEPRCLFPTWGAILCSASSLEICGVNTVNIVVGQLSTICVVVQHQAFNKKQI